MGKIHTVSLPLHMYIHIHNIYVCIDRVMLPAKCILHISSSVQYEPPSLVAIYALQQVHMTELIWVGFANVYLP